MAQPVNPEPKFFLVDAVYERGLRHYAETWFDALPEGRIYGEKTTNYLESPLACERIARDLPGVRLVFILRDPVERAYSNYLWSRQNALETEPSFLRALEMEAERERDYPPQWKFSRPYSYFSRGLYVQHLQRFFDLFPREHIVVLKTEDAMHDARAVASRLHEFLGVEPMPESADGLGLINAALDRGSRIPAQARAFLEERYREPNRRLAELLGSQFTVWDSDLAKRG